MLYTGGTTGNPKGVVWRHVDLFGALAFTAYASAGIEVPTTPADVGRIAAELQAEGRSPVMLCAPPLMHGTALFLAIGAFVHGWARWCCSAAGPSMPTNCGSWWSVIGSPRSPSSVMRSPDR